MSATYRKSTEGCVTYAPHLTSHTELLLLLLLLLLIMMMMMMMMLQISYMSISKPTDPLLSVFDSAAIPFHPRTIAISQSDLTPGEEHTCIVY